MPFLYVPNKMNGIETRDYIDDGVEYMDRYLEQDIKETYFIESETPTLPRKRSGHTVKRTPKTFNHFSVKSQFVSYSGATTLHGIKHVADASTHPLRRIIWGLAFFTMFFLLTFLISKQFILYARHPTATKISVLEERPLQFPAVTICNLNLFKRSVVMEDPIIESIIREMYDVSKPPTLNWSDPSVVETLRTLDTYNWTSRAAHHIDSMFILCSWGGLDANCKDHFVRTVTEKGFCYTFNSAESVKDVGQLKVHRAGSENGLWLRLNVEQFEYFYGLSFSAGFKVLLHDPFALPMINDYGFVIAPGTETFVAVRQSRTQGLPKPYENSTCEDISDPKFVSPLKYYDSYSVTGCRMECTTNYTLEKCGCKAYYQTADGVRYCNLQEFHTCVISATQAYYLNDTIEKSCGCFNPCFKISYDPRISSAFYPAQHFMDDINSWPEMLRKNFLELRIFYEELHYEFIEQVPAYTEAQLGADVGGQLGLCLGASFLTILEFWEFVMMALFNCAFKVQHTGSKIVKYYRTARREPKLPMQQDSGRQLTSHELNRNI